MGSQPEERSVVRVGRWPCQEASWRGERASERELGSGGSEGEGMPGMGMVGWLGRGREGGEMGRLHRGGETGCFRVKWWIGMEVVIER